MRLRSYANGFLSAVVAFAISMFIALLAIATLVLALSLETSSQDIGIVLGLSVAFFLSAQGVSFTIASIHFTIMPLLLTIIMMRILYMFFKRYSMTPASYCIAIVTWSFLNVFSTFFTTFMLDNTGWGVWFHSFCFATCVSGISIVNKYVHTDVFHQRLRELVQPRVVDTLVISLRFLRTFVITLLIIAALVVFAWIILGASTVQKLYRVASIPVGSTITMTLIALFWLPNIMLWAIAWVFGTDIHIGTVATYSLWGSVSNGLPALPVFGIFPQSVQSPVLRIFLLMLPILIAFCLAIRYMCIAQGFDILAGYKEIFLHRYRLVTAAWHRTVIYRCLRSIAVSLARIFRIRKFDYPNQHSAEKQSPKKELHNEKLSDQQSSQSLIALILTRMIYPMVTFLIATIIIVLLLISLFYFANGDMGSEALANVGVSIMQATQNIAKPMFIGICVAWFTALSMVVIAYVFNHRLSQRS